MAALATALFAAVLLQGGRSPSDQQEIAWLSRLAAAGNPDAQLQLGLAYREGRYGLTPDAATAQLWLEKAARNGEGYARDVLAGRRVLETADGAKAPRVPAPSRLDALAMQLNSPTLITVSALWKILGLDMATDQSGEALLTRAESGDPTAEFQLAMRYRDGAWGGVNRDTAKARYWLQRAAEDGNPLAMDTLAEAYHAGALGVAKDLEKAAHWHARAAAVTGPGG